MPRKEKKVTFKNLKYSSDIGSSFEKSLKKRVRDYFKDNNISKYANWNMKFKTVFMFTLYFAPYLLAMFGVITNPWLITLCWVLMGFGLAGIGMSVIHDANHGSYSKRKYVNYILGRFVNVVGAYAPTWKIQHNVLHHTYTNVQHFDEDLESALNMLRFTPDDKQLLYIDFNLFTLGFSTVS